jgi:hypothetical protein
VFRDLIFSLFFFHRRFANTNRNVMFSAGADGLVRLWDLRTKPYYSVQSYSGENECLSKTIAIIALDFPGFHPAFPVPFSSLTFFGVSIHRQLFFFPSHIRTESRAFCLPSGVTFLRLAPCYLVDWLSKK